MIECGWGHKVYRASILFYGKLESIILVDGYPKRNKIQNKNSNIG